MPSRQVPRSRGKPMWGQRLSSAYTCPAERHRTRVRPVTCTVLHPLPSRSCTVATRCQLVRVEGWDSIVIALPPGIGKHHLLHQFYHVFPVYTLSERRGFLPCT